MSLSLSSSFQGYMGTYSESERIWRKKTKPEKMSLTIYIAIQREMPSYRFSQCVVKTSISFHFLLPYKSYVGPRQRITL